MGFRVRRYPHNDLLNLASYHLNTINKKVEQSDREGVGLDCMSCLIALAFSVEALINFVGNEKVTSWKEGASYPSKLDAIRHATGMAISEDDEPGATLKILKSVRNQMAHGKPAKFTSGAGGMEELAADMSNPWDRYLEPVFCNRAFRHVSDFKRDLLNAAGISLAQSLTSAGGGW